MIEITIGTVEQFINNVINKSKDFIYRGQPNSTFKLESSFIRNAREFGLDDRSLNNKEKSMIEDFRSKSFIYEKQIPERNDYIEWLSLMQHYGAPTRLLDWTYSPFVACYFACHDNRNVSAIYELNIHKIMDKTYSLLRTREELPRNYSLFYNDLIWNNFNMNLIIHYEPKYSSERSFSQQGCFLFSDNISMSIENLLEEYESEENLMTKYIVSISNQEQMKMERTFEKMNINELTLFHGIDALGKYTRRQLRFS